MSPWEHWTYEAEFEAYNEDSQMCAIHVYFNVERDDTEVMGLGKLYYRASYEIEVGPITARLKGTEIEYEPTKEDLKWWDPEIKDAFSKRLNRNLQGVI